tara:strand:+ start:63174 stop:63323 length:150 start_codon:yes stop_codon:yes gene_type:complete
MKKHGKPSSIGWIVSVADLAIITVRISSKSIYFGVSENLLISQKITPTQ